MPSSINDLHQLRPILTMETMLKDIPREWTQYIEYRVTRIGWDDCWIWNGSRNAKWMPILVVDGKTYMAKRFVMKMFYDIPDDLYVKSCPIHYNCINPSHLSIIENMPHNNGKE